MRDILNQFEFKGGEIPVLGAGDGIVDQFDANGNLLHRLASPGGAVNAPWGLAIAPDSFGPYGGDLLVGNFGDGTLSVFDTSSGTGVFVAVIDGLDGKPLVNSGLWGIAFCSGSAGTLYFNAGINNEADSLFGAISLASAPEPGTVALTLMGIVLCGVFSRRRARRSSRKELGIVLQVW